MALYPHLGGWCGVAGVADASFSGVVCFVRLFFDRGSLAFYTLQYTLNLKQGLKVVCFCYDCSNGPSFVVLGSIVVELRELLGRKQLLRLRLFGQLPTDAFPSADTSLNVTKS